jgi:hypothetical protein
LPSLIQTYRRDKTSIETLREKLVIVGHLVGWREGRNAQAGALCRRPFDSEIDPPEEP